MLNPVAGAPQVTPPQSSLSAAIRLVVARAASALVGRIQDDPIPTAEVERLIAQLKVEEGKIGTQIQQNRGGAAPANDRVWSALVEVCGALLILQNYFRLRNPTPTICTPVGPATTQPQAPQAPPPPPAEWFNAAKTGNVALLLIAVLAGQNVNAINQAGDNAVGDHEFTALLYAVKYAKLDAVEFLLRHGASPAIACGYYHGGGAAPLAFCLTLETLQMLRLLCRYDANLEFFKAWAPTPLKAAATAGNFLVVDELLRFGAKVVQADADVSPEAKRRLQASVGTGGIRETYVAAGLPKRTENGTVSVTLTLPRAATALWVRWRGAVVRSAESRGRITCSAAPALREGWEEMANLPDEAALTLQRGVEERVFELPTTIAAGTQMTLTWTTTHGAPLVLLRCELRLVHRAAISP